MRRLASEVGEGQGMELANCAAVVVHFGQQGPTVRLSNKMASMLTSVVVVANDGSERPIDLKPSVLWVDPGANLGFGGGVMCGAGHCAEEVLLILNSDVDLSRDVVDACLRLMRDVGIGIIGPTLVNRDGSVQSAMGSVSKWAVEPRQSKWIPRGEATDAEWVTGAVMFIRRCVLDEVGFDCRYFLLFEDVDLCIRARRAGWKVRCASVTALHHQEEGHSIRGYMATYYRVRNHVWFALNLFGSARLVSAYPYILWSALRTSLAGLARQGTLVRGQLAWHGIVDAHRRRSTDRMAPIRGEPRAARYITWEVSG